ncbi:MAG: polysaccharide deacetylase family protein [Hyphomicrobiales bacterium]
MLPRRRASDPAAAGVPLLMYHSVSSGASRGFRPFAVTPERFEEQVRFIRDSGYESLTVSGLVEAMGRADIGLPEKCLVITFDDGLEDFYTAVLPILTEYGLTATLYVVTGYIGGTARWLAGAAEGDRKMLSWSQIVEISSLGVEIGAHTVTHPALDAIPLAEARREIFNCKRVLEDRLGAKMRSFAYPFGYYDRAVRTLVEEAGFDSACAVHYAMSSPRDNRFALSRHIVRHDAGADEVGAVLAGRAPLVPLLYDRARSNAWKLLRHAMKRAKQ